MQTENIETCRKFYNFFLIVHLKLCGHKIQKIAKSTSDDDRKSYFYFLPSEKLEKDKEIFFDDIPILVPLRTFEKTYKDVKFMANNPDLIKS